MDISGQDSRESRIYEALRAKYPYSVRAETLANLAGLSWRDDPVRAFTLLSISLSKLNQELIGTGWQAERPDGTPEAFFWLSPVGDG
jgi:hypothetical protein